MIPLGADVNDSFYVKIFSSRAAKVLQNKIDWQTIKMENLNCCREYRINKLNVIYKTVQKFTVIHRNNIHNRPQKPQTDSE